MVQKSQGQPPWDGAKNPVNSRMSEPSTVSSTLQGTNISPKNGILKMIFLFPRWNMLIPWSVILSFLPLPGMFLEPFALLFSAMENHQATSPELIPKGLQMRKAWTIGLQEASILHRNRNYRVSNHVTLAFFSGVFGQTFCRMFLGR